jgi:hypothetical protein
MSEQELRVPIIYMLPYLRMDEGLAGASGRAEHYIL